MKTIQQNNSIKTTQEDIYINNINIEKLKKNEYETSFKKFNKL